MLPPGERKPWQEELYEPSEDEPQDAIQCAHQVNLLLRQWPYEHSSVEELEKEILRAAKVEPDNARYNYLLAMLYLFRAHVLKEPVQGIGDSQSVDEALAAQITIRDPALLDAALQQLQEAKKKPFMRDCEYQIVAKQLAMLGQPKHFEQQYAKILFTLGQMARGSGDDSLLSRGRKLLPLYAEHLYAAGRVEDANCLIDTPWRMAESRLAEISHSHELWSTAFWIGRAYEPAAQFYEKHGIRLKAEQLTSRQARIIALRDKYDPQPTTDEIRAYVQSAGIIQKAMLAILPAVHVSADELRYHRKLEFVVMHRIGVGALMAFVVVLILAAFATAWRWRRAGQAPSHGGKTGASPAKTLHPLFLLPTWREAVRIAVAGFLFPLAIYLALSRIIGQDVPLNAQVSRFLLGFSFFSITMISLLYGTSMRVFHARCKALSIEAPATALGRSYYLFVAAFATPMIAAWFFVGASAATEAMSRNQLPTWAVVMLSIALPGGVMLVASAVIMVSALQAPKKYGLYHGAVARSLMAVFAGLLVVLACIVQPCLKGVETRLFVNDPFPKALAAAVGMPGEEQPTDKAFQSDMAKLLSEKAIQ